MGKDKFKDMIGKIYEYCGIEHTIKSIEEDGDGLFHVKTDKTTIKETARALRNEFKLVKNNHAKEVNVKALAKSEETKFLPAQTMLEVLQDNIEKVKKDPKYIPQAEAINKQVKTAIDMAKVQLDIYRLTNGK